MNKIALGLIGYGNVGSGIVKLIRKKQSYLRSKFDMEFQFKGICDLTFAKEKPSGLEKTLLTTDARELLNDPDIDVIVELIGGLNPAKDFVLTALKNGKHVVTANKALIAEHGRELFEKARAYGKNIYFETSVQAGVPLIKTLTEGLAGNQLKSIHGIINGTCNYILSEMSANHLSFSDAVKRAQEKGFAETDPTLDINGMDSAYKLTILTYLAFGKFLSPKSIYTEGITHISHHDIEFANEMGLVIKLLAISKKEGDEIEARVHPTLIEKQHPLASINGVLNAVLMEADPLGDVLLSGEGAGQMAAASGILSDLINLGTRDSMKPEAFIGNYFKEADGLGAKDIDNVTTKFYLRFMAMDKPGILSKISGVLGSHDISITSVSQNEHHQTSTVPVIILTNETPEKNMRLALNEIHQQGIVKSKPVAIRIEKL
ncbi:MAG: homoserine dehydrogenase [Candidatus Omnitrophota bacterium]